MYPLLHQQRIVVTVENSVLWTEMTGLESQEEDDPKCILFFMSMFVFEELALVFFFSGCWGLSLP